MKDGPYQKQPPYNLRLCSLECFFTVANAAPVALVWYDFFSWDFVSLVSDILLVIAETSGFQNQTGCLKDGSANVEEKRV